MFRQYLRRFFILKNVNKLYLSSVKQSKLEWPKLLAKKFEDRGWEVKHPGSDKYIALRGLIAVKWCGNCDFSNTPIRDEIEMYDTLIARGLKQHVPDVYMVLNNELIVEQRIDERPNYDQMLVFERRLGKKNIRIVDLKCDNLAIYGDNIKVIDGQVECF